MLVLRGHQDQVTCLAYAPDGQRLVSAGNDRTIRVWALATGQGTTLAANLPTPAVAVDFSPPVLGSFAPDAGMFAYGEGETITTCCGEDLRPLHTMTIPGGVRVLALSPRAGLYVGSSNRRLERRFPSGQLVALGGWRQSIYALAVAPDGKTLAVGGGTWPQTARLMLHQDNILPKMELLGHEGVVLTVTFSPDSLTLASGSDDRTVRLWDVATGREKHVLTGHQDLIRGLAFAPDGRTLTSVSWDGSVKVWDAQSGRERTSFTWHTGMVHAVAFAPDGMTAATAGQDGAIVIWDVDW